MHHNIHGWSKAHFCGGRHLYSVDFEGKPNLFSDDRDNSGWARLPLNIDLVPSGQTHAHQNLLFQETVSRFLTCLVKFEFGNQVDKVFHGHSYRIHSLIIQGPLTATELQNLTQKSIQMNCRVTYSSHVGKCIEFDCWREIIWKSCFKTDWKNDFENALENSQQIWLDQLLPAVRLSVLLLLLKRKSRVFQKQYFLFANTFQILIYWMQIHQRCQEIQTKT